MQSSISVLEEAKDISLLTLYAAKIGLNLTSSSSQTTDDQIELFVEWSSGEIARLCNRVLAQETVQETFLECDSSAKRIYLSRWPVSTIETVYESDALLTTDDYDLDVESGTLTRLDSTWALPVVVTYTGGYDLPAKAPPALQQAALLLTREAYNAAIRGDSTVRMVAHKESRIIYFDPNSRTSASGSSSTPLSGGSAALRAVKDLLMRYTRIEV